jgi:hypothetical protein
VIRHNEVDVASFRSLGDQDIFTDVPKNRAGTKTIGRRGGSAARPRRVDAVVAAAVVRTLAPDEERA